MSISHVTSLKNLKHIQLFGNPLYKITNYRLYAIC